VSRELQRQLADVQQTRDDERKQLLARLQDQRTTLGDELKDLRLRNAAVRTNTSGGSGIVARSKRELQNTGPQKPHNLLGKFRSKICILSSCLPKSLLEIFSVPILEHFCTGKITRVTLFCLSAYICSLTLDRISG